MNDRTLAELRLTVYELLLAMEAAGELAHSGAAKAFPAAWPGIGRLAPKRLERARRLCAELAPLPSSAEERKTFDAMRASVEELGNAYETLEAGPRNKVLGRVLSRAVLRVKGQSTGWG